MSRLTTTVKHVSLALVEGGLIAALAIAILAGTVFAGKPGATTAGGVRVDDGVYAGTTVAYAGPSTASWVRARCYQGGALVFEQYRQFDASRTATITLGPTPSWSGGSANCTAEDGYWRRGTTWRVTSSTTFAVAG